MDIKEQVYSIAGARSVFDARRDLPWVGLFAVILLAALERYVGGDYGTTVALLSMTGWISVSEEPSAGVGY